MRGARALRAAMVALAACGAVPAGAQTAARAPVQDFVPPAPGTYRLPPIGPAANGWVLEGSYLPRRLGWYTHGSITLLTFIYTYCTDPIGCPLAYSTLLRVRDGVEADPRLKGKVSIVSLSFDPTHDTPGVMAGYGGANARDPAVPWHFLTTYSMATLEPILQGFGQDIEVVRDTQGHETRARTHMLKMFLIDPQGRVREIYSSAFLLPPVILNDLRTLAMESAP